MMLVEVWVRLLPLDHLRKADLKGPNRRLVYLVLLADVVAFQAISVAVAGGSVATDTRHTATAYLDPIACCLA